MHRLPIALAAAALAACATQPAVVQTASSSSQPVLGTRTVPIIAADGHRFRDLNRNGGVDPYEDWRLAPDARARDLVSRMTLEEKAGAMMHGTLRASGGPLGGTGTGWTYDTAAVGRLLPDTKTNSMITRLGGDPGNLDTQPNTLQRMAALP